MFAQAAKPGSMIQLDLGDLGDDSGSEYFARLVRHNNNDNNDNDNNSAPCTRELLPQSFPQTLDNN